MNGVQPVILKIQIYNPTTINPLQCQSLDGIKEQKRLAGPPDACQTDDFAGAGGDNQFPWFAGRQYPLDELTDNVF